LGAARFCGGEQEDTILDQEKNVEAWLLCVGREHSNGRSTKNSAAAAAD